MDPKHFHGYLPSITEAMILLEAANRGHFHLSNKRLNYQQKQEIRSGSTFIINELKSGIKRWSDGMSWSNSKLRKGFFIYFQMPREEDKIATNETLLIKKTLTIRTKDNHQYHIINYYNQMEVDKNELVSPSKYGLKDLEDIKMNLDKYYIGNPNDSFGDSRSSMIPPLIGLTEKDKPKLNNLTSEDQRQLDLLNQYISFK